MDKLLPEFQKIADEECRRFFCDAYAIDIARNVAVACQELALRRPEMSDAEIVRIYVNDERVNLSQTAIRCIRAVLAAYESKRFAPVKRKVKCRMFLHEDGKVCCATAENADLSQPSPNMARELKWLGEIFEREIEGG